MTKISIFLILFILSCNSNNKSNNGKSNHFKGSRNPIYLKYIESKNYFPSKLVSHFPKVFDSLSLKFDANFTSDLGPLSFYLVKKEIITDSIKNYLQKISFRSYSSNDSCLLIINKLASMHRYIDIVPTNQEKKEINNDCYNSKFPIPNFFKFEYTTENQQIWQFKKNEKLTKCNLPLNYNIIIINAEPGIYVNDTLLSKNTMMPTRWEHGYSRGMAYSKSDSITIYWLNIW